MLEEIISVGNINAVKELLDKNERILIFSHKNPDGDAVGSSLALYQCLKNMGKDVSVVLPNAKFKFFVTAKSEVRAMRRFKELNARGEQVDFEQLHEEIKVRDKQDSEREFSPLICAEDAIVVDTSDKTIEDVVALIKSMIQQKI